MKGILILSLAILAVIGFFVFLGHSMDQAEQRALIREQEWLVFSQRNHCKIVHESTFSNPMVTWQCDGNFEVRR